MYDVNIWMALDSNGNEVTINEAVNGTSYKCMQCGGELRARAKDSICMTPHFYHLKQCECNGEGAIHKYWKKNLIQIGESIKIPTYGNITCVDKKEEHEIKFSDSNGEIYRPDFIIKTDNEDIPFIIFEIYYSNKKRLIDYKKIWKQLNKCMVIEVDVNSLDTDKSNLLECMTILYDEKRESFYRECTYKIKQLYSLLNIFRAVNTHELKYSVYQMDVYEASLENTQKVLGKFYRIFKTGCYEKTKIRLDLLHRDLYNLNYDSNISGTIISDLKDIFIKLKIYN